MRFAQIVGRRSFFPSFARIRPTISKTAGPVFTRLRIRLPAQAREERRVTHSFIRVRQDMSGQRSERVVADAAKRDAHAPRPQLDTTLEFRAINNILTTRELTDAKQAKHIRQ